MKLLLSVFALMLPALGHAEVGFSNGNRIGSTIYRGNANVICTGGGFGTRWVTCSGIDYTPESHDVLTSDQKITAKSVELLSHHPDGSTRKKSMKWDSKKNESGLVNLTTSTLLQKPLLEYGVNKVDYKITGSDKKVVSSGSFNAEFVHLGNRSCSTTTIYAYNYNDCQNDSYICNQYFHQAHCN